MRKIQCMVEMLSILITMVGSLKREQKSMSADLKNLREDFQDMKNEIKGIYQIIKEFELKQILDISIMDRLQIVMAEQDHIWDKTVFEVKGKSQNEDRMSGLEISKPLINYF